MFKYLIKNYTYFLHLKFTQPKNGQEYDYKAVKNKVGVMSAGQLALLALQDAYRKKIDIVLLADKTDSPASLLINPITNQPYVKKENIVVLPQINDGKGGAKADWMDLESLKKFVDKVGIENPITLEWENVPYEAVEYMEETLGATVFPNSQILKTIQDRSSEKEQIQELGGKTVEYAEVDSIEEINNFIEDKGPIEDGYILKSRKNGYDGKGQTVIREAKAIQIAFDALKDARDNGGIIIEKMCDLDFEASVIVSREADRSIKSLEPIFNIHENGMLKTSIAPTDEHAEALFGEGMKQKLMDEAEKLITNWTDYNGILTVEFFVDKAGKILVNEVAPRTHNSGHATIDTGGTSQNELWLNSVSGRITKLVKNTKSVVMKNLLIPEILAFYKDRLEKGQLLEGYEVLADYFKVLSLEGINVPSWDDASFDVPDGVDPRKVGHMNFARTNKVNELLMEVIGGTKTLKNLLDYIEGMK
ncbi:ATP-grasp domain-containing protein [Candidatus Gracilibacteria bacterium]|nr:ATP-grasp domain-containing protein [Candidatus Gracilibacteria bacterium]